STPGRNRGSECECAIPPYDHAGWIPNVRGDDQLRTAWLGDGQDRLSVRWRRSGERLALAPDARCLRRLATRAAANAGFNEYVPDRNEKDFDRPIISESLGLPAVFLLDRKSTRLNSSHGSISYAV